MTQHKKKRPPRPKVPVDQVARILGQNPEDPKPKVTLGEAFRERTIGAPSKYDKSFHPRSYLDLSAQGKTKAQICAAWGTSRETLHTWSQDRKGKPELLDAIKAGDELRTSWWSNFAQMQAAGRIKGHAVLTIFLMKNICSRDFKDRIHHVDALDVEDMDWGDDEV